MDAEINNVIYMELNSGRKIANSTCGKTIDVETIDRDSTVYDMDVSCHRPFLPGTSLEPAVIPTAQGSSFTLQYFPYYV